MIGDKVYPIWPKVLKKICPICAGVEQEGWTCNECEGTGEVDETAHWFVGPAFVISKVVITITSAGQRVMYHDVATPRGLPFVHRMVPSENAFETLIQAEIACGERNNLNEEAIASECGVDSGEEPDPFLGDVSGDVSGYDDSGFDQEDETDGR